jgi:hypothetical protein
VLLILHPIINEEEAKLGRFAPMLSNYRWAYNERLLVEGADVYVQPSQVLTRRFDLAIERLGYRSPYVSKIKRVLNSATKKVRDVSHLAPTRGELELEAYGREHLISQLTKGVVSFPTLVFIDDFGLYRNTYTSVTGIYTMPAGLPITERQKSSNAYTIALGPHGSDLNGVTGALHISLEALERGCTLRINGKDQIVWGPIIAFLGDMKQQQMSAGFLSPRANRCCRFCDATKDTRGDMKRDIVRYGRYHHQILGFRQQAEKMASSKHREEFLASHGLSTEQPALQSITPALDLTLSRPPDPAHSEYYGIIRKLYPMLYKKILFKRAASDFTMVFQRFPLPPGWGRIQSPEMHMGSWSMSECGKASIIVPLILRTWLKPQHLRKAFCRCLSIEFPIHSRPENFSDVDLIVYGFGRIAKSNTLTSAFQLLPKDRRGFHGQILEARRYFLGFMRACEAMIDEDKNEKGKGKTNSRGRVPTVSGLQRSNSPSPSVESNMSDDQTTFIQPTIDLENIGPAGRLPNFHIGIHFEQVMEEYGVLWNANVLFGEHMHKFFKQAVISTNHHKPERQILLKDAIRSTYKAILNDAFLYTDMEVSKQISRIKGSCPSLLESLLSSKDQVQQMDLEGNMSNLLPTSCYTQLAVRGRLRANFCKKTELPIKVADAKPAFKEMMQSAMAQYNLHCVNWGSKPLYWYEQCSFTVVESAKRLTLHVGDYVLLASGEYAQLQRIYTHLLQFEEARRLFFWVRLLETAPYMDKVLSLAVYHQTQLERIVSLSQICPSTAYIIPIARTLNEASILESMQETLGGQLDLLHCTWDVNFL